MTSLILQIFREMGHGLHIFVFDTVSLIALVSVFVYLMLFMESPKKKTA